MTSDPFLVFTSNLFAILGLRSPYFALAAIMDNFRYFKLSLVFVLSYVGAKMILTHRYPIPPRASLVVIASLLAVGRPASLHVGHRDPVPFASPLPKEAEAGNETPANEWRA